MPNGAGASELKRSLWLARLLGVGGVLESLAGLGLLVVPSAVASFLLGSSLAGSAVVVARIGGGGLLALGLCCWFARMTPAAPASIAVAWALVVYNAIACVTLALAAFSPASGGAMTLGASVLHAVFGLALIGPLRSGGRSGTVAAGLLAAVLMSGPARAAEDWEFWPEVNAFAQLDPQLRLHFAAAYARGKDSYLRTLDLAGYLDVSLKPRFRKTLRQEDWLKNKYVWARFGYVHVFETEDGVRSPAEDRAVASLYTRAYLPIEVVLEGRGRVDLRWIDGEYSTRYRLRGELNHEFSVFDHALAPYGNVEWFYDDRYDGWSRIQYQAGAEITFSRSFRGELYLARQQQELPRESILDALGVVAKWYF